MPRSAKNPVAEPDLDALQSFSELPDGEATPYFGGRTDEIGLVERAQRRICERARDGHWRPSGGETFLFQGAPGAGKSELLRHFARRLRSAGPVAPVVVDTVAAHYVDASTLAIRVAEAVDPTLAAPFRHLVATHSSNAKSLQGGDSGGSTGIAAAERLCLSDVMKAALELGRTVVLILDDAQDLEDFAPNPTRMLISSLHTGAHGGPLLPVFAGHTHSDAVFEDRGISRLSISHDRTLKALSFDEAVEIVHRMLTECRVRGDQEIKRQWAHALANDCSGWPQHLHVAMQALAGQLLVASTPGQLEAVDSSFGVAVLRESALARDECNERRIDAPLAAARHLLANIFRRIGDGAPYDVLLNHVRVAAHPGVGPRSLPNGFDEEQFVDHMFRRGVLQRARMMMLACPIPSFREYIERMAPHVTPET